MHTTDVQPSASKSKVNVDSGNFLLGASRSTNFQTSVKMSYLESTRGVEMQHRRTQWIKGDAMLLHLTWRKAALL